MFDIDGIKEIANNFTEPYYLLVYYEQNNMFPPQIIMMLTDS